HSNCGAWEPIERPAFRAVLASRRRAIQWAFAFPAVEARHMAARERHPITPLRSMSPPRGPNHRQPRTNAVTDIQYRHTLEKLPSIQKPRCWITLSTEM